MRSYNLEKDFLNKSNCGTGLVYNKKTEQFDVTLDIKTDHLIKVTYDELVDLRDTNSLEPGVFYRITDYEFTSTDPEVISAGHRFDIIVLALSENTLNEDARAIQHEFTEEEKQIYSEEEQHYFDSSNLAAWKLKYTIDVNKTNTRFDWVPSISKEAIVVNTKVGCFTLQRNETKDENGYIAFENDNYTFYTTSETPKEGDLFYEKINNEIKEVFGKKIWYGVQYILVKNGSHYNYYINDDGIGTLVQNDAYSISGDASKVGNQFQFTAFEDEYGNGDMIVLNPSYTFQDDSGESHTGILAIRTNFRYDWGEHYDCDIKPWIPLDFSNYSQEYSMDGYVMTLNLSKYPEIGDTIEVIINGDLYVPGIYKYIDGNNVFVQPYHIQKIENRFTVTEYIPKPIYKGVIYGMIDEFENDCEYDFKNALIIGKYSPFNPDQFYYTFTNQGKSYAPLLDSGEKVILYPGTYSFLGNIPFRLYEGNSGFNYIKPDVSNDSEYKGWDLYAAICDTEGYINEDTGERHYKLEMYVRDKRIAHAIKVCEDKQWYTKEVITDDASKNYKIYSKDSDGNVKEYSLINRYENYIIWYLSDDGMKYMPQYRAWIYYSSDQWGHLPYDTYSINLNYKKSIYKSGNDFDVHPTADTYAHDLTLDDYCGANYVISDSYSQGVYFQSQDDSYTITWFTQNLNKTNQSNSGSWEFVNYDSNIKFTKPFTITEPMYVYLKSTVLTDSYIDCYVDDVVFSPDIKVSTDSDLWCAGHSIGSDLYSASTFGGIVLPRDTSCSYYNTDCYRVTLRPGNLYDSRYWIPKVICEKVRHSNIKANKCTLQDCYCVIASNAYHYEYDSNKTFLKNVRFSNLQNVDNCKFEDCYTLLVEGTQNSTFGNISNTHIFNCHDVNIQSVADSIFENINATQICHVSQSRLSNLYVSQVCSVNSSNISNLVECYFTNSNSYGDYSTWYNHYKNIYINGLQNKTIDFAELLGEQYTMYKHPGHCVHIRSEEDLTIVV